MNYVRIVLLLTLILFPFTLVHAEEKTIRISGNGGQISVMTEMAKAFKKKFPDINILLITPPLGSTGGIKAVVEGALDLGLSARNLKDNEKGQGLIMVEYGITPFVFVVRPENPIPYISLKEVTDIYSGTKTQWPDGTAIRVVLRPPTDSHTSILKGISKEMADAWDKVYARKGMIMAATDDENADFLEKTPSSFGALGLCQIIMEKRKLKVLSLNGVRPSVKTISDGRYQFSSHLYLVKGHKSSPLSQRFIDFVLSTEGKKLLGKMQILVK